MFEIPLNPRYYHLCVLVMLLYASAYSDIETTSSIMNHIVSETDEAEETKRLPSPSHQIIVLIS